MSTETQILPKAASKKEIYNKFQHVFAKRIVRNEMNEVIKNSRQCSLKEAQDTKRLKPSEVAEVLKRFE